MAKKKTTSRGRTKEQERLQEDDPTKILGEGYPHIDLPCEFTGLGFGKTVVRLGCRIARERLSPATAALMLVNARCNAMLTIDGNAGHDAAGQETWDWAGKERLTSVADVKGFSLSQAGYTFGLSFAIEDTPAESLEHLHHSDGRIFLARIGQPASGQADAVPDDDETQLRLGEGDSDFEQDDVHAA